MIDAHAHLDDAALAFFVESIGNRREDQSIIVLSNSVDCDSSMKNLKLAEVHSGVRPFVGIHPEILGRRGNEELGKSMLDDQVARIAALLSRASGVGEIGLDDKYGSMESQKYLLEKMLYLAEPTRLPITFHCRGSVQDILQILSTFNIRGNVLFHWFAGSEAELRTLQTKGAYVSFGPSVLYSKRLGELARYSDQHLTLVETDSPTRFNGITGNSPGTPVLISSVIFKLGLIQGVSFRGMLQITNENALRYLQT